MDAKITKQRLANLFSYDWLKMLVAITLAVVAFVLLFTMVGRIPTEPQTYTVYADTNLYPGKDASKLQESLEKSGTFSYDILKVEVESFYGNEYASTAFNARRAAGKGTVMFMSAYDSKGEYSADAELYFYALENMYAGDGNYGFYEPKYFLETLVKNYLEGFFGKDFNKESALDESAAEARFLERNGKDRRFTTAARKKEGIENEKKRLIKLRDDYLVVRQAFADGKLYYTCYQKGAEDNFTPTKSGWGETEGNTAAGIGMGELSNFANLYTATDKDGKFTTDPVNLVLFRNSEKKDYDLCYETVSFLRYLVENYGG